MIETASLLDWAAIAAGGALGAVLRGLLARLAAAPGDGGSGRRFDPALATLTANLAGCALLGAWTTSVASGAPRGVADGLPDALSGFVAIGICGSLSTFSTLCADADRLARNGGRAGRIRAIGTLLAHLAGGPLALAAGARLAG